MDINKLEPGIYYQDILEDGSRSVIRQNFPTLKRTSFDTRPRVNDTLVINVSVLNGPVFVGVDQGSDGMTTIVTTENRQGTIFIKDVSEIPPAYKSFEGPSGTDGPEGTDVPLGSRPFSQNRPSTRYQTPGVYSKEFVRPETHVQIKNQFDQLFCKHDWNMELGDHEGVTKKTCTICNKIEFEHA